MPLVALLPCAAPVILCGARSVTTIAQRVRERQEEESVLVLALGLPLSSTLAILVSQRKKAPQWWAFDHQVFLPIGLQVRHVKILRTFWLDLGPVRPSGAPMAKVELRACQDTTSDILGCTVAWKSWRGDREGGVQDARSSGASVCMPNVPAGGFRGCPAS